MNLHREEYGDERLIRLLVRNRALLADELFTCIRDDVQAFVDGAGRSDDITIITITRAE